MFDILNIKMIVHFVFIGKICFDIITLGSLLVIDWLLENPVLFEYFDNLIF